MRPERFGRVELPRQFGLGQSGVDFIVTDLVQTDGRTAFAALELRDQVVKRLPGLGRDRAEAQGADRVIRHGPR